MVSLFDSDGRKLVATAGKQGVLHVVSRQDGKLVFKLPMTTLLNQDVPITPEGVRVCPSPACNGTVRRIACRRASCT